MSENLVADGNWAMIETKIIDGKKYVVIDKEAYIEWLKEKGFSVDGPNEVRWVR